MKTPPANCAHCGRLVPQSPSSIRNHKLKFHPDTHRTKKGPEPKPRKPVDRSEEYRTNKIIRIWRRLLRDQMKAYNEEVRLMNRFFRDFANMCNRDGLSINRAKATEANRERMKLIKEKERQDGAKRQSFDWQTAIRSGFGEYECIKYIKTKPDDVDKPPPKEYLGDIENQNSSL